MTFAEYKKVSEEYCQNAQCLMNRADDALEKGDRETYSRLYAQYSDLRDRLEAAHAAFSPGFNAFFAMAS